MKLRLLLICAILLFSGTVLAFDTGGLQPVAPYGIFSTFSTESVPQGKAAIEVGLDKSKDPAFYRSRLSLAYGLSEVLEFNMTIPYVLKYTGSVDGMEDVALGFKYRFYDEGKYGPSVALLLNASVNNGSDAFTTHGRFGGGLIISKRIGPFTGHVNLLFERPGTGGLNDEIAVIGGVELAAAHSHKILAEMVFKRSHYSSDFDRAEARFGYRLRTTDSIYTTIGLGLDLKKRDPEYRVLFAVSLVPRGEKKPVRTIIEEE